MGWGEICLLVFARSLLLGAAATGVAAALTTALRALKDPVRRAAWLVLLAPFFVPDLVVGYGWSTLIAAPVRGAAALEVLYAALVLLKCVPVASVLQWFSPPPPLSPQAIHCRKLLFRGRANRQRSLGDWWSFARHGRLRAMLPAFAVAFLIAFQEFEMASLLQTGFGQATAPFTWTVPLFDLQAGGWPLEESLLRAVVPMTLEAMVLVPALWVVLRDGTQRSLDAAEAAPECGLGFRRGIGRRFAMIVYATVAVAATAVLPAAAVMRNLPAGVRALIQDPGYFRELANSLATACASSALVVVLASWMIPDENRSLARSGFRRALVVLACTPGLMGPLLLGLCVLWVFRRPLLNIGYDTPLPLVAALVLHLLPRALLLTALARAAAPASGAHLAQLLRGSGDRRQRAAGARLLWTLRTSGAFWAAAILATIAFWELSLGSLLAPVGMNLVPVSLYNQMHFGRSTILAAKTAVSAAAPWLVASLVIAAARLGALRSPRSTA